MATRLYENIQRNCFFFIYIYIFKAKSVNRENLFGRSLSTIFFLCVGDFFFNAFVYICVKIEIYRENKREIEKERGENIYTEEEREREREK